MDTQARKGLGVSANNWTVCPKCKAEKAERLAKAKRELDGFYGMIPLAEYSKRQIAFEKFRDEPLEERMREDYELGVDSDGQFEVSYRCSCEECDFAFSFKETREVNYAR